MDKVNKLAPRTVARIFNKTFIIHPTIEEIPDDKKSLLEHNGSDAI